MKRKEVLSKEQALLEKRHRRSNLEILKLPTGAMRVMKDIAGSADLPVDRVFKDVIEAGLAVIRNPESSPYESMIQFRKTLHEHKNVESETKGISPALGRGNSTDQSTGEREMAARSDEEDYSAPGAVSGLAGREPDEERSGDADEQSRRATETESGNGVSIGSIT